jgi:adenylate cyclase
MRLTANELEALGVYDPQAPHAGQKLELLEYLVALGATREELVTYRDELPSLASILAIRGSPSVTLGEAIERSGLSEDKLRRLVRAAGFAEPGRDDLVFSSDFADLVATVAEAEAIFGEEAVLQLLRVMGSTTARLADAVVSAFLVNVEPAVRDEDPVGLSVARANVEAAALLPFVGKSLETLLRQHLIAARRTFLADAVGPGYETRQLSVGFVDMVGSTAMARRLSTRELGAALTEFERLASDTVVSGGGRVVKLIGDEILYTSADARSACGIALAMVQRFADHSVIPQVRAAVASGEVLLRGGDVFGPVVSLAARAVKLAGPGEIVTQPAAAAAADVPVEPLGEHQLSGFDEEVELCRLRQR